jgi:hypothetical protein
MKPYVKELVCYALAAFVMGVPLQIIVDWLSGRGLCTAPLWAYLFAGLVFSLLMTLFKYIADMVKSKRDRH